MAENWVTRAEMAKILGCTPKTISNYKDQGMPHRGGGKKGSPLEIETVAALAWYVAHEAKKRGTTYETPDAVKVDYARELALEKSLDRQLKEITLEEKRGNLLPRAAVEYVCASAFQAIKQEILPLGRRIIPTLKSHQNEALALSDFNNAIYAALTAAAQTLSEAKITPAGINDDE